MEILGIGPLEFGLILVLTFILLGPGGMVRTARDIGNFIRKVVQSEGWRSVVQSSQEIRQAQDKFMKESGLQQSLTELRNTSRDLKTYQPDPFKDSQTIGSTRPSTENPGAETGDDLPIPPSQIKPDQED